MSADVLFECFTILTERNVVFGTTIRVIELPFSASVALQESASHFYNSRERPLFFDPLRSGDSDKFLHSTVAGNEGMEGTPALLKAITV